MRVTMNWGEAEWCVIRQGDNQEQATLRGVETG
jgi:hypothetical protein